MCADRPKIRPADDLVRPRRGRPSAADAPLVAERVLAAAQELFLRQGYARTAIDQVAEAAQASKNTVYARFPGKAELFAAVVERYGNEFAARTERVIAGDLRERLVAVLLALADQTLTTRAVALMRVTAAETDTFPDVARQGFAIGFGHCVRLVVQSVPARSGLGSAAVETLATRLVEMALHPLYMHAFFGADLSALRRRACEDVPHVVDLVLAAPPATTPTT